MSATAESTFHPLDKGPENSGDARMRAIASDLRWREGRWFSGKGRVDGPITALHAVDLDDGSRVPCYGVNSLHATSTDYLLLAEMLGPEQPFFSVHPPSDERNAERARSIPGLAKYYVDALVQFQPTGALALAGWSAGAIVALEMAQQLKNIHGREVSLLIAIDYAPLNTPADKRPFGIFERVARFYYGTTSPVRWAYGAVKRSQSLRAAVKVLRDKAEESSARKKAFRQEEVSLFQRHPAEARLSFFDRIPREGQEYAKALYTAAEEYVPAKYSGPVVVYVSTAQPLRIESRVEEKWRDIADSVEVFVVKGTHESILEPKDSRPLAEHLKRKLDQVASALQGADGHR
jgi:thioesterase domain-containing protein